MNTSPADNFDEFAVGYRELHNKNMQLMGGDSYYFAKAKVQHVKEHEHTTALNILDVGCGDGTTATFMTSLFPGCKITGIDISAESILIARERNIAGAEFSVYDGFSFPFAEGVFDLVFIAGVLHHVTPDVQEKIILETYKVLRSGGRIYVFEHNPFNPATKYLVKTCPFDKYARLLRSSKVRSLLNAATFKKIKNRYITFFPRNKFFSAFHAIEKYFAWCSLGAQFYVRATK